MQKNKVKTRRQKSDQWVQVLMAKSGGKSELQRAINVEREQKAKSEQGPDRVFSAVGQKEDNEGIKESNAQRHQEQHENKDSPNESEEEYIKIPSLWAQFKGQLAQTKSKREEQKEAPKQSLVLSYVELNPLLSLNKGLSEQIHKQKLMARSLIAMSVVMVLWWWQTLLGEQLLTANAKVLGAVVGAMIIGSWGLSAKRKRSKPLEMAWQNYEAMDQELMQLVSRHRKSMEKTLGTKKRGINEAVSVQWFKDEKKCTKLWWKEVAFSKKVELWEAKWKSVWDEDAVKENQKEKKASAVEALCWGLNKQQWREKAIEEGFVELKNWVATHAQQTSDHVKGFYLLWIMARIEKEMPESMRRLEKEGKEGYGWMGVYLKESYKRLYLELEKNMTWLRRSCIAAMLAIVGVWVASEQTWIQGAVAGFGGSGLGLSGGQELIDQLGRMKEKGLGLVLWCLAGVMGLSFWSGQKNGDVKLNENGQWHHWEEIPEENEATGLKNVWWEGRWPIWTAARKGMVAGFVIIGVSVFDTNWYAGSLLAGALMGMALWASVERERARAIVDGQEKQRVME